MSIIGKQKKVMLCAALICVMLVGAWLAADSAWHIYPAAAEPQQTADPAAMMNPDQFVLEENGLRINTQYMSFLYPLEYANEVMINLTEEETQTTLTVLATFDGMDMELYSLILGMNEGEGFKLGELLRATGSVGIYVRMNELNTENWPEEEIMRLSRLQESVNALFEQMYQDEGFTNF